MTTKTPLPLEITFRDIENTEAISTKIKAKAEKLHHLYERITFCHVVVEAVQKSKHQGKEFQVNIEVNVPGKVLVVTRQSHRNEDLYVAIRDSFNAMKRQLEDYVDKLHSYNKTHPLHLSGKVARLFPDYGFIETDDGNEYYFHETNFLQEFSKLKVGHSVYFMENMAGDSLRAHQVSMTLIESESSKR